MQIDFSKPLPPEPDADALREVARFSRRPLAANEVYLFRVTLCDNEIDRDHERFSLAALHRLRKLFVGVTGVFDHNAVAANQSARVFRTGLVTEPRRTAAGEIYTALKADCYMARTNENAALIAEIDAGIKKEVSVSCSVGVCRCSICGKDLRAGACSHRKGETYGGRVCCGILDEPTDAYEFSFVAVPAQRAAGVTKNRVFTEEPGGADDARALTSLALFLLPDADRASIEDSVRKWSRSEQSRWLGWLRAAADRAGAFTPVHLTPPRENGDDDYKF